MAAARSVVRVHRHGEALTFQVDGHAAMSESLAIRCVAERAISESLIRSIRVDLRHCTHMDSTFLGTLLLLQRVVARVCHGELLLISPSNNCQRELQCLALDKFFDCRTADELPAGGWTELLADQDLNVLKLGVVEAHQALADLPGPTARAFQAVARLMTQPSKESSTGPT